MRACAHLYKLVLIDGTPRFLVTIEGLLFGRSQGDMLFGAIPMGMLVEWEGKIVGRAGWALGLQYPLLKSIPFLRRFAQILRKEQPSGEHTCAKSSMTRRCFFRNFPPVFAHHILER